MSVADDTQSLTVAVGLAFRYAAILIWVSDFIENILRTRGLAESHFGWSAHSAKLLRRNVRWLSLFGIPLAAVVVVVEQFQDGEWSDSVGRLAYVAGMLLLAYFMHAILNSKNNILRENISREHGRWFAGLRTVSHWLGIVVPLLLAALAVAGYYYSAQQVALRWQATLGVALVVLFGYSVAARWCLVKRRNLAIDQARERQRQAAETVEIGSEPSGNVVHSQIEQTQSDLSEIHEQLRYLLRHAATRGDGCRGVVLSGPTRYLH